MLGKSSVGENNCYIKHIWCYHLEYSQRLYKDVIDEAVKTEPVVEQVADVPSFQSEPECSFSVIIRDSTGKCIEVKYDGPVSGMEEAGEQIKIIAGDGK